MGEHRLADATLEGLRLFAESGGRDKTVTVGAKVGAELFAEVLALRNDQADLLAALEGLLQMNTDEEDIIARDNAWKAIERIEKGDPR